MQKPPLTVGGDLRNLSDDCVLLIHDTDDGMCLVIDNQDKREITLRFDFSASDNLKLSLTGDAEGVPDNDMRCNLVAKSCVAYNLCELLVVDKSKGACDLRYRVQCLVRNAKGELEQVAPSKPKPKKEAAAAPAEEDAAGAEKKKITDTLWLHIVPTKEHGYRLHLESTDRDTYIVAINTKNCDNLTPLPAECVEKLDDNNFQMSLEAGKEFFLGLDVTDFSKGSCQLDYRLTHRKDSSKREAAEKEKEEADRKAKEEADRKAKEDADRKAKEEADRKAKEEADRKAKEEADRKAKEDADRKAKEEADRKAKEEADRKAKEEADRKAKEEADRKAKEEADRKAKEEADRKAKEEADRKAKEEADRKAKEEADKKAREEAERKQKEIADKLRVLQQEEQALRHKIEAEQLKSFMAIEQERRETICNLCRGLLKPEQEVVNYKIYRLHRPCYDKAPKCDQCGDILIGEYVVTKGDVSQGVKLHKECIPAYKQAKRPVCTACGQQILDAKWTQRQGKPYHDSCAKGSSSPR